MDWKGCADYSLFRRCDQCMYPSEDSLFRPTWPIDDTTADAAFQVDKTHPWLTCRPGNRTWLLDDNYFVSKLQSTMGPNNVHSKCRPFTIDGVKDFAERFIHETAQWKHVGMLDTLDKCIELRIAPCLEPFQTDMTTWHDNMQLCKHGDNSSISRMSTTKSIVWKTQKTNKGSTTQLNYHNTWGGMWGPVPNKG